MQRDLAKTPVINLNRIQKVFKSTQRRLERVHRVTEMEEKIENRKLKGRVTCSQELSIKHCHPKPVLMQGLGPWGKQALRLGFELN